MTNTQLNNSKQRKQFSCTRLHTLPLPMGKDRSEESSQQMTIDFWESYDPDVVCNLGFALIASEPFPVRAVCFLCGSAGQEQLIHCASCCEPYHRFCLEDGLRDPNIKAFGSTSLSNWVCQRCTVCSVCGNGKGQQLSCQCCHRTYHTDCLSGRRLHSANRPWVCSTCLRCKSCGTENVTNFVGNIPLCKACFKLRQKGNYCPLCQRCYEDHDYDTKMMECVKCNCWVHSRCEGLSDEKYHILSYLPDTVEFICRKCCEKPPAPWWYAVEEEMKAGYLTVLKLLSKNRKAYSMLRCSPKKHCEYHPNLIDGDNINTHSDPTAIGNMCLGEKTDSNCEDNKFLSITDLHVENVEVKMTYEVDDDNNEFLADSKRDNICARDQRLSNREYNLHNSCSEEKCFPHSQGQTVVPYLSGNSLRLWREKYNLKECSVRVKDCVSKYLQNSLFPVKIDVQCAELSDTSAFDTTKSPSKVHQVSLATPTSDSGISSTDEELKILGGNDAEELKEHALSCLGFVASSRLLSLEQCSSSSRSFENFTEASSKKLCSDDVPKDEFLECNCLENLKHKSSLTFLSVKNKVNSSEYTSVLQFHQEMEDILNKSHCSDLLQLYYHNMQEVFPWFNPKFARVSNNPVSERNSQPSKRRRIISEKSGSDDHNSSMEVSILDDSFHAVPDKMLGKSLDDFYSGYSVQDNRVCVLCKGVGDGLPAEEGRLLYCGQNEWAHTNCALWSAEVFEEIDGSLQNVHSAMSRGRQIRCDHCGKRGASVGCCTRNCPETFHFPCARKVNCTFMDDKNVFCPSHAKGATGKVLHNESDFEICRPIYVELDRKKKKFAEPKKVRLMIGSLSVENIGEFVSEVSDTPEAIIPNGFSCTRLFWSSIEPWRIVRYHIKTVLCNKNESQSPDCGKNMTVDHSQERHVVEEKLNEISKWRHEIKTNDTKNLKANSKLSFKINQKKFSKFKRRIPYHKYQNKRKCHSLDDKIVYQVVNYMLDIVSNKDFDENSLHDSQSAADHLPPEVKEAVFEDLPHDLIDGISMQDVLPKLMIYEEMGAMEKSDGFYGNDPSVTEKEISSTDEANLVNNHHMGNAKKTGFLEVSVQDQDDLCHNSTLSKQKTKQNNVVHITSDEPPKRRKRACSTTWNCKPDGNYSSAYKRRKLSHTVGRSVCENPFVVVVDSDASHTLQESRLPECVHVTLSRSLPSGVSSTATETPAELKCGVDEESPSDSSKGKVTLRKEEGKENKFLPWNGHPQTRFLQLDGTVDPLSSSGSEGGQSPRSDDENNFGAVCNCSSISSQAHGKSWCKTYDTEEESVCCSQCRCTYRTKKSFERHLSTCCNDFMLSTSESDSENTRSSEEECTKKQQFDTTESCCNVGESVLGETDATDLSVRSESVECSAAPPQNSPVQSPAPHSAFLGTVLPPTQQNAVHCVSAEQTMIGCTPSLDMYGTQPGGMHLAGQPMYISNYETVVSNTVMSSSQLVSAALPGVVAASSSFSATTTQVFQASKLGSVIELTLEPVVEVQPSYLIINQQTPISNSPVRNTEYVNCPPSTVSMQVPSYDHSFLPAQQVCTEDQAVQYPESSSTCTSVTLKTVMRSENRRRTIPEVTKIVTPKCASTSVDVAPEMSSVETPRCVNSGGHMYFEMSKVMTPRCVSNNGSQNSEFPKIMTPRRVSSSVGTDHEFPKIMTPRRVSSSASTDHEFPKVMTPRRVSSSVSTDHEFPKIMAPSCVGSSVSTDHEFPKIMAPRCVSTDHEFPKIMAPRCVGSSVSINPEFPKIITPKCVSTGVNTSFDMSNDKKPEYPKIMTPRCASTKPEFPKIMTPRCVSTNSEFPKIITPRRVTNFGNAVSEFPNDSEFPKIITPRRVSKFANADSDFPKIMTPRHVSNFVNDDSEFPKIMTPRRVSNFGNAESKFPIDSEFPKIMTPRRVSTGVNTPYDKTKIMNPRLGVHTRFEMARIITPRCVTSGVNTSPPASPVRNACDKCSGKSQSDREDCLIQAEQQLSENSGHQIFCTCLQSNTTILTKRAESVSTRKKNQICCSCVYCYAFDVCCACKKRCEAAIVGQVLTHVVMEDGALSLNQKSSDIPAHLTNNPSELWVIDREPDHSLEVSTEYNEPKCIANLLNQAISYNHNPSSKDQLCNNDMSTFNTSAPTVISRLPGHKVTESPCRRETLSHGKYKRLATRQTSPVNDNSVEEPDKEGNGRSVLHITDAIPPSKTVVNRHNNIKVKASNLSDKLSSSKPILQKQGKFSTSLTNDESRILKLQNVKYVDVTESDTFAEAVLVNRDKEEEDVECTSGISLDRFPKRTPSSECNTSVSSPQYDEQNVARLYTQKNCPEERKSFFTCNTVPQVNSDVSVYSSDTEKERAASSLTKDDCDGNNAGDAYSGFGPPSDCNICGSIEKDSRPDIRDLTTEKNVDDTGTTGYNDEEDDDTECCKDDDEEEEEENGDNDCDEGDEDENEDDSGDEDDNGGDDSRDTSLVYCNGENSEEKSSYIMYEICSQDGFCCTSKSFSEAWQKVFDAVQNARIVNKMPPLPLNPFSLKQKSLQILGLKHNAVRYLVEQLPGVGRCVKYKPRYHKQRTLRPEDDLDTLPPPNKSGCIRTEPFKSRRPYDMFSWLASSHRNPPKFVQQNDSKLMSNRRATSSNLPMAMRFRNLKRANPNKAVGVYQSHIHGRGLFCLRDIESGEMVIEYAGEVIRSTLTEKREKLYESKGIGCYMFRIDDQLVVDATMRGNAARFINHSCDPNCYSRVVDILGKKHILIFALRRIPQGEELTYDYKFPFEDVKIPCTCGSRKCRKYLN
ncbi:histone-lysine N-methyltransferase trithorax-like [Schistocerca gregaria]|uniref:histone-lysine N-methyltransferase trithorax-like n=1 Tax=Schistocerca gregaria TaxID=7010 RepID=UPI00211F227B|nr:histone-lysine N-methyltransferase trithorax-like [Schistocerca gregaria]